MAQLEAAIRPETALVSIMFVNNEIGVVQPMKEIGKLCRSKKIFFHTDAAQAVGKMPIDVNELNIDLMSISAHKIYGPKGFGACYVRRRPRVRLDPIISGGGQERGLRSGTLAPALVIGFGEAARIAKEEMEVSGLFPSLHFHAPSLTTEIVRYQTHKLSLYQTLHRPPSNGPHPPQRLPLLPLPRLRQRLLLLRGGRIAPHGAQRHCALLRQRMYLCLARALVCSARARE